MSGAKRHDAPTAAKRQEFDWRSDIFMPGDDTQSLADVLVSMRENHLQRPAAFVEWIAADWYDARRELAEGDFDRRCADGGLCEGCDACQR